ncbi:MAG: entericidin A/B family lipoprotein [Aestuariibacter sp.]|jgi:predicted small secreted protein|nr:entericidin A/B family lipoprotein [Marisediminitalea aggregata]MCP3865430.1 entericidin A/B family lipoprotein [Aestuariibacter sp.]MCP4275124.1 entericidin A/B family lipoprotein [Gammaproteobacteria bacterium]MCP4863192.1 entericidin A/B family lipoprotein [Alteromonas sp.]MCP4526386.1 entericidin A/B family lipoprotein [Aestuariibacter sp.]MCP9480152.1 entericidin A/B family lipoprotein [Marisediminitalea aggregata]|tara:strand:+ start:370 stop:498 length:129 start_codon:yes stop_codon:yes gene_type:complete
MFKRVLMIMCIACLSVGCATLEGAGKDIENAGKAIQDAVDSE